MSALLRFTLESKDGHKFQDVTNKDHRFPIGGVMITTDVPGQNLVEFQYEGVRFQVPENFPLMVEPAPMPEPEEIGMVSIRGESRKHPDSFFEVNNRDSANHVDHIQVALIRDMIQAVVKDGEDRQSARPVGSIPSRVDSRCWYRPADGHPWKSGYLRSWSTDSEQASEGTLPFPVGVVEDMETGAVASVYVNRISFSFDKPQ